MANPNWVKGVSGNPAGSKKTAFKEDFNNLLEQKKMFDKGLQIACDKWDEIIEAMAMQAIKGNVQAAIFIRDTFIGKPKDTVQHDMTDQAKDTLKLIISKDESCL